MAQDPFSKSFLSRIKAGLSAARDLSGLADWVVNNTRDPRDSSKPFSFKDHEFQIAILSETATDAVTKKPSQVGLSEVSVRMALGLTDIYDNSTVIYTFPTATDAALFVKARFDTVIEASPELSAKVDPAVDNASVKKIGRSFLYVRGTFSQRAAISIPAQIIISDEVDFSDQAALSSYTSRLGHVKEEDIIRRRFSTPTVGGYGVSALFDDSTQAWRAVKCDKCGTWQVPKFLDDVKIPGYDRAIEKLEKDDIDNKRYKIDDAYVSCPHCRHPLTVQNLGDPNKRAWAQARPGMARAGYQVQPFDLPHINTTRRVLRHLKEYKRKADWVNFAVGQEYEDAETSFVKQAVQDAHCLHWVEPRMSAAHDTVMGVDVGKTSWITIGVPGTADKLDILHYERVRLADGDALPNRVKELALWYGTRMVVIDAGPEWTQALEVIATLPPGTAYACYYSMPTKPTMSFITDVQDEEHVVRADRTAVISDVAKRVNSGKIRFCRCPEQPTMEAHLDVMKKIRRPTAKGGEQEVWVNAGDKPDHFAHSLFFCSIAAKLLGYNPPQVVVPCLPLPGVIRFGQSFEDNRRSYLDRK